MTFAAPDEIGEAIGDDSYVRREYLLPDGSVVLYPAGMQVPPNAVFIGLQKNHKRADGRWCGGWVGFVNVEGHPDGSKHTLVSADPLTVAPSLLCRRCEHHGWIREGRWVPA